MALDTSRKIDLTLVAIISTVLLLIIGDIATDLSDGASRGHVLGEGIVLVLCATGMVLILSRFARVTRQAEQLRVDLTQARKESEHWRSESRELIAGLGAAIETQFRRWSLSPAERDVALFLLKGLSHKEVAELRSTSERTVRQQSREVYRKSGLSGRAALSAFFLEDLLLPVDPETDDSRPG